MAAGMCTCLPSLPRLLRMRCWSYAAKIALQRMVVRPCLEGLQFRLLVCKLDLLAGGGKPDCDTPVRLRLSLSSRRESGRLWPTPASTQRGPPATSNQAHVPGARRYVGAARR